MTLESKKISMAQWILSISEEELLEKVSASIDQVRHESDDPIIPLPEFSTYATMQQRTFDLEQLKVEQHIRPFEPGELEKLVEQANIEEDLDTLLADLS